VVLGEAGEELVDVYSRQRRHAAVKYVQGQTIANMRLMEERDPAVRAKNFEELRRTADNPETAKAYMRRAALFDSLKDAAAVT
jgi:3-(3-hydroxy-phenyl)propionate hydroxylase